MSNCQCGSKKKAIAPNSFSPKDTGGFCFLLGLDSFICPLIDKIPSLIGSSWKLILKSVAEKSLNIAIDQVTNRIKTSSFCATERPPLPPDITYEEVFLWLAGYIPVIGGFADSDPLLVKITEIYLYQKWLDYCECKSCEPLTPENPFTNPPINSDCPPTQDKVLAQNFINQQNDGNSNSLNSANAHNQAVDDSDIEGLIAQAKAERENSGEFYLVYLLEHPVPSEPPDTYTTGGYSFGCIDIAVRSRTYKIWTTRSASLMGIRIGETEPTFLQGFSTSRAKPYLISTYPTYQRCDCFPPPELPKIPKPIPPVEFCDRFPDDPFCSQDTPPDCEVESINVMLFRECNLPKYTVTRELNATGNDEAVSVQLFDTCQSDRVNGERLLIKCEATAISGCTDPTANNYNPLATVDDGSCVFGCSGFEAEITAYGADRAQFGQKYIGAYTYAPYERDDVQAGIYELQNGQTFQANQAPCENQFREYFRNGWFSYWDQFIYGCTDPTAANYDETANIDDGSCQYANTGCTDPSATNYDPFANVDDGSCVYE